MADPFIFLNTYDIRPGEVEAFKRGFQRTADLVEAQEPRMLYFACHVSEDGTQATTVQVHADADNMAFHMQLIGDQIRAAGEYLEWSSMSIRIYGSPGNTLLEQMRQMAGSGISVTVSPPVVGFNRFSET
ncbi:MAG: hypothetical protein KY452_08575 [Actinobacteria bacterium]|nr:hypothetical protein [Actinomycetota bacterium]